MRDEASERSKPIVMEEYRDHTTNRGGWITFPFIMGSLVGSFLSHSGATGNFMVYLVREYNVKIVDAAQISNVVSGCISVAPVAAAIIADSLFGCYPVIVFSNIISLLSMILLALTAGLPSLRPSPSESASAAQLAFLYTVVGLIAIGSGGMRYNVITLGASQFDRAEDRDVFFNWYFIALFASSIAGSTAVVFVEDSISWTLGFWLSAAFSGGSLVILLLGAKHYRTPAPEGSPFVGLARVVVAAFKKRNINVTEDMNYHHHHANDTDTATPLINDYPTQSLRSLNRAAWICQGDTRSDGSVARPWSLCTVQQVEDLKALINVFPLWSSSICLSVSIGMQVSLSSLQALTMDRSLAANFSMPVGTQLVSSMVATVLTLLLLDRFLFPLCHRLAGRTPTTLQRIGLGHIVNVAAIAAFALVERQRAGVVRSHHAEGQSDWIVPMSALWLLLPLAVMGVSDGLHFPAQVALYYQAFPGSMRNTATGVMALIIALGFFLSSVAIDLVRSLTDWLPDNINASNMETVYWAVAVATLVNFGYFLFCAMLYKRHKEDVGAMI